MALNAAFSPTSRRPWRGRWLRSGLAAVAGLGAIGYLAWSAQSRSVEYYRTIPEARAEINAGRDVRVLGVVQNDITRSEGGLHVTFTAGDGDDRMPVEYQGPLPDIFQPGISVVVEGRMAGDGVFHARSILAKCPSRFSTRLDTLKAGG